MTATAIAAAESPDAAGPRTTVRSTLAVSVLAALVPALAGLAFLGRYGWDRDELYFLEASHHLAFGYVDFPPLTAVVGRAVVVVFGTSLDALRLTTMVIGLTSVAFVALSARELGGGLRAQAAGGAGLGDGADRAGSSQPLPSHLARSGGRDRDALPGAGRGHPADAAAVAGGGRDGRHRPRGQVHDRDAAAGAGGGARADAAAAWC